MKIKDQIAKLGAGELTEEGLKEHIWPLFSRVLNREGSPNEIYMANHSLGRPLDRMAEDVNEGLSAWYNKLDKVWGDEDWWGEMNNFRARIAQLIGLDRPDCVVPKTAAGQGLRAVLNALPQDGKTRTIRVVSTRAEFDSIDFILKTYVEKGRAEVDWVAASSTDEQVDEIMNKIVPGVDLVVLSMISFGMGIITPDLTKIIAKAHECGCLVMLDAYHSAGVVPINMTELNADFVVGGCYKYLRGGAGACWLAIHPRLIGAEFRTLDTGWFAKKNPFEYERTEAPELSESGDSWLESTPPVLTYYQARSGLEFTLEIGVERLREYNLKQQEFLRQAMKVNGIELAVDCPKLRGAFLIFHSADAQALSNKLMQLGVNTDWRGNYVRFGPDILNSNNELLHVAKLLKSAL